jgi:cephalosporin-C deacetylase-like acetyl esterase
LWAAVQQPGRRGPAVLVVDSRGKSADARTGGYLEQWVRSGRIVLAVDLQGYGETADLKAKRQYANAEFRTSMVAMHLGRTLLGGRIEDLLAARQALLVDPRVDPTQVEVVGVGRAGLVVLHAAALEPGFARVTLRGSLSSWARDVVAKPQEPELVGQVVPSVLKHYDLSELKSMLGQEPVVEPAP